MTYEVTRNDGPELAYPDLRPNPHHLQLLIRAAVVDDGHGGPWLSVVRTHTGDGTAIYTHHIHTNVVDWHSSRRLVLISGDEVLSYVHMQRWPNLFDPTATQLRKLGTYAVELHDAPGWNQHYITWHQRWTASDFQRRESWELARGDARALRWREAEQWLAHPSDS